MNSKDHSLNFQCSDCGKQYPKWQGQCFACNKWDTIIENISNKKTFLDIGSLEINETSLIDLSEVSSSDIDKDTYKIEWPELNRALGGDFISGAIVLIAGMPGVGKSTLLMQLSAKLSKHGEVVYLCGEESIKQVTKKFERLNIGEASIKLYDGMNLNEIAQLLSDLKPKSIFVDSIQSVYDPDTQ